MNIFSSFMSWKKIYSGALRNEDVFFFIGKEKQEKEHKIKN